MAQFHQPTVPVEPIEKEVFGGERLMDNLNRRLRSAVISMIALIASICYATFARAQLPLQTLPQAIPSNVDLRQIERLPSVTRAVDLDVTEPSWDVTGPVFLNSKSPRRPNYQLPGDENIPFAHWLPTKLGKFQFDALARAYYAYDRRIEFTGQETSFVSEAVLTGALISEEHEWKRSVHSELYVNQPFDRNILVDTPERASYAGNFQVDTLEISQLYVKLQRGDLSFSFGKMVTPFGRAYFPVYQNDRQDSPFIRTESILWRETGAVVQYEPSIFIMTLALTNGSEDRDTNSSKALVARVGLQTEDFAIGGSVKTQDGIGSENQKQFNEHLGVDLMWKVGPFRFSAEAIYDTYGYRQPINPLQITWGRSVYGRDANFAFQVPLLGIGYYANVDFELPGSTWMINYGEFHPQRDVGDPIHDIVTRRGIIKVIFHATEYFDPYFTALIENDVPNAQAERFRSGVAIFGGFQFGL